MSRTLALVALLGLIACGEDSPTEPVDGLPFAVATPSCGPADAPIVMILLTSTPVELPQPVAPFIEVQLPESFGKLARGRTWLVGREPDEVIATFHSSGLPARTAQRGEVGITWVRGDEIRGFVDLVFDGGLGMRGSFAAPWQDRQLLCGQVTDSRWSSGGRRHRAPARPVAR